MTLQSSRRNVVTAAEKHYNGKRRMVPNSLKFRMTLNKKRFGSLYCVDPPKCFELIEDNNKKFISPGKKRKKKKEGV